MRCEAHRETIIAHTQHEQIQQTLVTQSNCIELLTQLKCLMQSSRASQNISPTTHFQSNEYNKIPVARDGCVLKATNFNGFLRVNKWCVDAPAVNSNRCGPELSMGVQFR